jgi:hypothetical protein
MPESSRPEPRETACAVLSVVACLAAMVANISQGRPRYMVQSDSKFVGHLGDRLFSVKKRGWLLETAVIPRVMAEPPGACLSRAG